MNERVLQALRLRNFKAIQDSGELHLTALTAFIGYNGSGKSSIVEGLQTFQQIVERGLDTAMQQWRGFEHIRNQYPYTAWKHQLENGAEALATEQDEYADQLNSPELSDEIAESPQDAGNRQDLADHQGRQSRRHL